MTIALAMRMTRSQAWLRCIPGVLIGVVLVGAPAFADSILYTTSGYSGTNAVAGTATFTYGNGVLTIELQNTTAVVNDISQVLDGFGFTLAGGNASSLTNVTASGFEDCTDTTCTAVSSFTDYTSGSSVGSPYTWALVGGNQLIAGAADGGTPYKPGGIVNSSVASYQGKGNGGLGNDQHNDYLMGPVTFELSYTGTITGVTAATFYWGTQPVTTVGVPESSSLLLLAVYALGTMVCVRRLRTGVRKA